MVGNTRGQCQAINVPVRVTITNAWNLRDHQIVGAPDWIARDRFDIVAKEPGARSPMAKPTMSFASGHVSFVTGQHASRNHRGRPVLPPHREH